MTSFNFNIKNVFPGTEKQKAVGIYASFTLDIVVDDGILITASDMKLRKRRNEDIWYVESPFRTYTNNEEETKKAYYVKLWPEKENWPKQEAIVSQVRAAVEDKLNNNKGGRNTSANQPTAASQSSSDEPW